MIKMYERARTGTKWFRS